MFKADFSEPHFLELESIVPTFPLRTGERRTIIANELVAETAFTFAVVPKIEAIAGARGMRAANDDTERTR